MLDFTELSKNGEDLELMTRELLFAMGYYVYWSGRGPDGGRDLICYENRRSDFLPDRRSWLIQCKHHAHSGAAVGIAELDNVVDSCTQHGANGYLLVTTTVPSSAVVERLESISDNPATAIVATYWDQVRLEHLLTSPTTWKVAQRFLPVSANRNGWQVYATESPNHWIVIYKGYYLHATNRISSTLFSLESVAARIEAMEAIKLPKDHFIRPRGVYYDDKNGNFTWYLDYMHPREEEPVLSSAKIKRILGDGYALEDGQFYTFDVQVKGYFRFSDHYDPDHYEYYIPFVDNFVRGSVRASPTDRNIEYEHNAALAKEDRKVRDEAFSILIEALNRTPGVRVARALNARIEEISRFSRLYDWSGIIEDIDFEVDTFFSAWFLLVPDSEERLLAVVRKLPQGVSAHFRLTRAYVIVPGGGYDPNDVVYELRLSVLAEMPNRFVIRKLLNDYFLEIAKTLDDLNKAAN